MNVQEVETLFHEAGHCLQHMLTGEQQDNEQIRAPRSADGLTCLERSSLSRLSCCVVHCCAGEFN